MVSMSQHAFQDDGWREGRAHRPGEPSPSAARSLGRDGRALLEHTVRQDVIPRLVAMRWVERATPVDTAPAIGDGTIRKLVALCLEPNSQVVAAFVTELHRSGVAPVSIYEDLLAPAARQLGVMWENNSCTFADVTIGVLRLQNAQRLLAAQPLDCAAPPLGAPRALLMPVPGEQHTFGLSMVLDYFVRAGWEARLGPVSSREQALALVRRERTEMLGLGFACDERVADAAALIVEMRRASGNPDLIVMVGGPSFLADPDLAGRIGADATAVDGQQAVLLANSLLHHSDGRM